MNSSIDVKNYFQEIYLIAFEYSKLKKDLKRLNTDRNNKNMVKFYVISDLKSILDILESIPIELQSRQYSELLEAYNKISGIKILYPEVIPTIYKAETLLKSIESFINSENNFDKNLEWD